MPTNNIAQLVDNIPSLRAVLVATVPDCLLVTSWQRDGETWDAEAGAAFFGDLVRANRSGLELIGAWSSTMQTTIESGERVIVLRHIEAGIIGAFVFLRETPLGLVRLHVVRLAGELARTLTANTPRAASRGQRLLDYLERYAPDTHAALLRVSLQTGLPLALLRDPDRLADDEFNQVIGAARQILGLEHLAI
jgi:hypothetical protein